MHATNSVDTALTVHNERFTLAVMCNHLRISAKNTILKKDTFKEFKTIFIHLQ